MSKKVFLIALVALAASSWAATRGVLVEHFGWTS
jgi:hypothetical protein